MLMWLPEANFNQSINSVFNVKHIIRLITVLSFKTPAGLSHCSREKVGHIIRVKNIIARSFIIYILPNRDHPSYFTSCTH